MKNSIKIFLIIFIILVIVLLADTIQAKVLNNRPFIKITEDYNNGNVYKRDKGVFVYTYNFYNGEKVTVFRWEKYSPPDKQKNMESDGKIMKPNVNVVIYEKKYNVILEDNKTVQEFINLLPKEFDMEDLNENEKYIYLDKTLPTNSYNPKHIEKGDIMLYGNNCLVVFYKSFDTSYSYTKIGHIENLPDLENKNITIKFENN